MREEKERLKKQQFDQLQTGWMAPNGDFYPCGYMEHIHTADMIIESMPDEEYSSDPENVLKKKGWVEIHMLTYLQHKWLFDFYGHLTPEQKQVIKSAFEKQDRWDIPIEIEEELES